MKNKLYIIYIYIYIYIYLKYKRMTSKLYIEKITFII